MKKLLLLSFFTIFSLAFLSAQTVVLDFEDAATSTTFQYFGSSLEPNLTEIIENPDASGINTSAMVSNFIRPSGAQTWAGAFSNPNPSVPIDLTSNTELCVKVWFSQPGNLAVKLEGGTQGNWIDSLTVTETETWVELCYDVQENSFEDPFTPAFGGVYSTVVLFFDFQKDSPTEDQTYYFDDLVLVGGSSEPVDLTFTLDMNDYDGSFTTPFVSGTFNEWSADANPMSDDDGDNIWTATVMGVPVGSVEYKFQLDGWADQEVFNGFETCTVTSEDGMFTNRSLVASPGLEIPTVCYNSCYACGEGVLITLNVGDGALASVAEDGLFIAGGGNFGSPGDFPLNDDDGDGIHTLTIEREAGFFSYFTFTNGACPDWGCKENIAGQDCANPDNFNDRFMGPIMQDTIINTCFALCTTDTNCADPGAGNITFNVDMNSYAETFNNVYVTGSFVGWSGDAHPMADDDGDGVYTITIPLNSGTYEYKFEVDNWADQELFTEGDPCTVTNGGFTNRVLQVEGDQEVCYVWNSCDDCTVGLESLEVNDAIFTVQPNLVQEETTIVFGNSFNAVKSLSLYNAIGQKILSFSIPSGIVQHTLNVANLQEGLYIINVETDDKQQSRKIIINRN